MSALFELLDLMARWIHVVAGIMWIGNSLLFNWLDRNLRPRRESDVDGDIWLIHSGGFYLVEKNRGKRTASGDHALPQPLHWFKWQAYTTWISGAVLLLVVYYVGGRALLVDPAIATLSHRTATLIAVGTIAVAFAAYEIVWRSIGARSPAIAGVVSIVLLIAAVEWFTTRLAGRAAFVHMGAMLGTLMAGNVVFTIMPSQRELVAALRAGRSPSQAIADQAKTRSIHNNYLTFPVIAMMLSAHFPMLYSHRGDFALLILIAGGATVRHALNIRFIDRTWGLKLAGAVAATVVLLLLEVDPTAPLQRLAGRAHAAATTQLQLPPQASFVDVRRVIDRRCAACHSSTPSDVSLGVTPAGVAFDTPEQIHAFAERIRERAFVQRTMPPANRTRMTDSERALLAKWIGDGAQLK